MERKDIVEIKVELLKIAVNTATDKIGCALTVEEIKGRADELLKYVLDIEYVYSQIRHL